MAGSRGEEIRARRISHGMSVRDLAKVSKVDRQTITRAEGDDPTVTELTYARIERALEDFEIETGADEVTVIPVAGTNFVKFTIHGVYGAAEVIVEGPVENLPELQNAVDRLLRGQHSPQGDESNQ